jgi:hypothetical protein
MKVLQTIMLGLMYKLFGVYIEMMDLSYFTPLEFAASVVFFFPFVFLLFFALAIFEESFLSSLSLSSSSSSLESESESEIGLERGSKERLLESESLIHFREGG